MAVIVLNRKSMSYFLSLLLSCTVLSFFVFHFSCSVILIDLVCAPSDRNEMWQNNNYSAFKRMSYSSILTEPVASHITVCAPRVCAELKRSSSYIKSAHSFWKKRKYIQKKCSSWIWFEYVCISIEGWNVEELARGLNLKQKSVIPVTNRAWRKMFYWMMIQSSTSKMINLNCTNTILWFGHVQPPVRLADWHLAPVDDSTSDRSNRMNAEDPHIDPTWLLSIHMKNRLCPRCSNQRSTVHHG